MATLFRILGAAALVGAAILAAFGDARGAVAATLVGLGAFLSGPGRSSASQLYGWIGFALICGGIGVLVSAPLGIVVFVSAIGMQFVATRRVISMMRKVKFEPVAPGEAMPETEDLVREFSSAGFMPIGGHRFVFGRRTVVVTVLMPDAHDRMGFVTDHVWQVVSRYGSRWLVTTNAAQAPLPETILRQSADRLRPSDLVRLHEEAVDTIRLKAGVQPDRFADRSEALRAAQKLERTAIEFVSRVPLRRTVTTGVRSARLEGLITTDDARSQSRIGRWLAS